MRSKSVTTKELAKILSSEGLNESGVPFYNKDMAEPGLTMSQRGEVLSAWTNMVKEHVHVSMQAGMHNENGQLDNAEIEKLAELVAELYEDKDSARASLMDASAYQGAMSPCAKEKEKEKDNHVSDESRFYAERLVRGWFDCIEDSLEEKAFVNLNDSLLPFDWTPGSGWAILFEELEEFPVDPDLARSALRAIADDFAWEPFDEIPVLRSDYVVFQLPEGQGGRFIAIDLTRSHYPDWVEELIASLTATNKLVSDFWKPYEHLAEEMAKRSLTSCKLDYRLFPTGPDSDRLGTQDFLTEVRENQGTKYDEYIQYISEATTRMQKAAKSRFERLVVTDPRSKQLSIVVNSDAGHNSMQLCIGEDKMSQGGSITDVWRAYNVFCHSPDKIISSKLAAQS